MYITLPPGGAVGGLGVSMTRVSALPGAGRHLTGGLEGAAAAAAAGTDSTLQEGNTAAEAGCPELLQVCRSRPLRHTGGG